MNLAHQSSKILVTGQSGQGKSTYFARFLSNAYRTLYEKIFVYDHVGEISARLNIPPAYTEDDLSRAWEAGFICFDPAQLFPGETDCGWNFFCEWVFARCQNNMGYAKLLAVDELQMFSSTANLSWEQCCVVETGRKYELDFLAISQQMNLIHNRLRNQLTEIVTFRQEDKLIIDALEERGFEESELRSLQKGEFLIRNFQNGSYLKSRIDLTQQSHSLDSPKNINPPDTLESNEGEDSEENNQ